VFQKTAAGVNKTRDIARQLAKYPVSSEQGKTIYSQKKGKGARPTEHFPAANKDTYRESNNTEEGFHREKKKSL